MLGRSTARPAGGAEWDYDAQDVEVRGIRRAIRSARRCGMLVCDNWRLFPDPVSRGTSDNRLYLSAAAAWVEALGYPEPRTHGGRVLDHVLCCAHDALFRARKALDRGVPIGNEVRALERWFDTLIGWDE